MLNGKFFVGLPAGMMDHASGPNRQQTNFFWPDESSMEAAVDTRSRLRHKNTPERSSEKTIDIEINPNELHKKQLSSKINLDENLPKPKSNVPAKPSNLRRRDTFTSKIQFYDFDNEPAPQQPKTNKNSNAEVEKNLNNSTKTSDKRITFIDNKTQHKGGVNIGRLKNNQTESKLTPSTLPKKPTIKNISKSKSMTDISAENNIKIIENDVKNISISKPSQQIINDSNEYVAPRRQIRTILRPTPLPRRSRPLIEYYEDNEDDHFCSERKQSLVHPKISNYSKTYKNYERQPGFQENYLITKDNRDKIHESHRSYTTRAERLYSNRGRHDVEDGYEYQIQSRGSELPRRILPKEPPRSIKVKLDVDHYDNEATTRDSQTKFGINPHAGDHHIDEGQKPNNLKQNSRNQTTTPAPISRAHRHLVSNVAFWNDTETTNNSNQRTIRNSAVTRVSVGLPDT